MPDITYEDLTISIGLFGGNVTVTIRGFNAQMTEDQLMALIYPVFDKIAMRITRKRRNKRKQASNG